MTFFIPDVPKADSPNDRLAGTDVEKYQAVYGPAPRCPRCNKYLGMRTWLPPYRVELETWGERYSDVILTGDDLVVSSRFVEMIDQYNINGLSEPEPIEVVRVRRRRGRIDENTPSYFKVTLPRSCTTVDQVASGYEWENRGAVCPVCLFDRLQRHTCIVILASSWTGEDIFFPRGGRPIVVSERFKSSFEGSGLLGFDFVPAEEFGYDSFPWESRDNATDGE